MAINGMKEEEKARGMEALHCLKSTSPPLFLSPSSSLSETARSASLYLFSALLPSCPKSPFDRLLVEGFDAEQIWHQIDLQTKPLIANLRRDVKRLEANPDEIIRAVGGKFVGSAKREEKEVLDENGREEGRGKEGEEGESFEEEDEDIAGVDEESGEFDEEEDEEEEEGDEEEGEDEGVDGGGSGIEDRFLKIKELEEFLEKDEEREYGSSKKKHEDASEGEDDEDDEDDNEEEEDDDDEEVSKHCANSDL